MSTAFYIVLDHKNLGFDTFVSGKAVAHCDGLEKIINHLGLNDIYDYVGGDFDEFIEDELEDYGDSFDEEYEERESGRDLEKYKWFSAKEGMEYFTKIKTYLQDNASEVDDADYVISDLDEYIDLLRKASLVGARWHLQIDS